MFMEVAESTITWSTSRAGADFQEWRKPVRDFFAAPPQVGHTATVVKGF